MYGAYIGTTGMDYNLRYLTWRDIDSRTHVIPVTRKPLFGFKPKNNDEREVPVPESLIEARSEGSKDRERARLDHTL
jgi:integrase